MHPPVITPRSPAGSWPATRRGTSCGWWAAVCGIAITLASAAWAAAADPSVASSGGLQRTPGHRHKVDHAVQPAGGGHLDQPNCRQCRKAACPQCRLATEHHHGHAPCRHGLCPAHCPVRPDVFGFYGTQWRRWPGSGVVQTSNLEAATPSRPEKAAIPGPLEESLEPMPGAEDRRPPSRPQPRDTPDPVAPPDAAAGDAAGRRQEPTPGAADVVPPQAAEKLPAPARAPEGDAPTARPEGPSGSAQPEKNAPAKPPKDEDLFNLDDTNFDGPPRSTPWRSFTAEARRS